MTEFERYFEETFNPLLARLDTHDSGPVFTGGGGIRDASWDRNAAYLLFVGGKLPEAEPW